MPDRQIQTAYTALKAAPLAYILTFLPVATNRDAGPRGFVTGGVAPFFPEHHMRFADIGLSDELLRALSEAGYDEPTPIQAAAIPQVQMMRDIIAIAQTGTGKTASFVLPMIDVLANGRARARMPRSLILEPTRELAAQVAENFEKYGKYHKLSMALPTCPTGNAIC